MITIKSKKEIELLRQGGKILSQVLVKVAKEVKPGITTGHLEKMACSLIEAAGGRPSFMGYQSKYEAKPFPTALCTSINNQVVHAPALPARQLKDGDIIGLDLGIKYPAEGKGCFTDMAITIGVGKISPQAENLIQVAERALELGISQVYPGNNLNQVSIAIQQYVEANGFSVVRQLVGHGIGRKVHEDPQIPNYDVPANEKIILKPGMVLAIEPMVNAGGWQVIDGEDGFSILTADGLLSSHFEHTVLVTEDGYEILTL